MNLHQSSVYKCQDEVNRFFTESSLNFITSILGSTICFLVDHLDSRCNCLTNGSVIKMPIGINLVVVTDITTIVNSFVVNKCGHHKLINTSVHYRTDLSATLKIISTLCSSSVFSSPSLPSKLSSGSRYNHYNLMCPIILIIISTSLVSASTTSSSSSPASSPSTASTNNVQSGRRIKSQPSSGFNLRMVQNNDLASSSSSVTTVSSINRITTANQINTFWLVAIIFNATLAALFFLIFCYLCLKKSLQSRKVRLDSRHGDPLFTRKSFTAPNESNGQKQSSVYTIPMDKHLLSVNSTKQSSINKFKMAGRLTGRMATSSPIQSNNTISTLDSFSESNPSSPARYDPPPKNLQGPFDNLQTPFDENAEKVVNFTGPAEAIHAAKSLQHNNIKLSPVNPIQAAENQVKGDFEMKKDQSSSVATNNHNKQDTIPINQYNSSPLPPSSLSLSSTSSTTISQITGETKKETVIESKDLIVDRVLNYEKPANSDCDKNENGLSDPTNHQHPMKHKNKKALAVGRDLQNIGSRVVAKLRNDRKTSVSIQTSPTIWFGTVDLKSNPTIAWEPHPVYSEPFSPNHDSRAERKYFIYLVTDASPYFRKNCIGKISLPAKSALTLSQLRDILMKAEDSSLKDVLKKNRSFRFLTETYRFVAQNEAIAPIDQVYPTQGIFIKLSAPDYSIMPTTDRSDTIHTTKVTGTGNRRRTYRDDAKFATFINISETNPEKNSVKNQENFKQKRITFNQQTKREQPIHTYQDENNSEPVSTSDPRKRCARPTCNKPAIMGCGKCNNVFYCGIKCKNIHFSDHRSICSKPPWKF